jgi:hypothetical protein
MAVISIQQVNLARFFSKEMYFILSGDDLDLNLNDFLRTQAAFSSELPIAF